MERFFYRCLLPVDKEVVMPGRPIPDNALRMVLDKLPDAVFCVDGEGRFTYANQAALLYLQFSWEELAGLNAAELLSDSDPERWTEFLDRLKLSGSGFLKIRVRMGTGRQLPLEIGAAHVQHRDADYYCAVVRDTMELSSAQEARRRSDVALVASEAKYRDLAESLPEGIFEIDAEGNFIYLNQAGRDMLGLSPADVAAGINLLDLIVLGDRERARDEVTRGLQGSIPSEAEYRMLRVDGTTMDVVLNSTPVDCEGRIVGFRALVRDVTEIKKAEEVLHLYRYKLEEEVEARTAGLAAANLRLQREVEERRAVEKRLRALVEEKEVLVSEINHRVKNNMQVITSLLNLQTMQVEDDVVRRALEESRDRITAMSLIHETLRRSDSWTDVDFGEYVRRLSWALLQAHGVNRDRIRLNVEAEDVIVDVNQATPCGLIINELITNALKYAFEDDRRGLLFVRASADEEGFVTLVIRDDGPGLPDAGALVRPETLGLTLVAGLVERQLQGSIQVSITAGTEYRIVFPRHRHEFDPAPNHIPAMKS